MSGRRETKGEANARMACLNCGVSGAEPYVTAAGKNIRTCGRCFNGWMEACGPLAPRDLLPCEGGGTVPEPAPQDGAPACTFPDCGCAEARLCMAGEPNQAACAMNPPRWADGAS